METMNLITGEIDGKIERKVPSKVLRVQNSNLKGRFVLAAPYAVTI